MTVPFSFLHFYYVVPKALALFNVPAVAALINGDQKLPVPVEYLVDIPLCRIHSTNLLNNMNSIIAA